MAKSHSKNYLKTTDGFDVFYEQFGQGHDLLLLHGIGASHYCWRKLIPLLSPHFSVTLIDLPGFGWSSKLPHLEYGLDQQHQRIMDVCRQLKLSHPHLLGSSMGGTLALWMKLQSPKYFSQVTTIAPATNPELVPALARHIIGWEKFLSVILTRAIMKFLVSRSVSQKQLLDSKTLDHYFNIYKGQPSAIQTFFKATTLIKDIRLSQLISKLKSDEHLVLYGSNDRVVPSQVMQQLQTKIPQLLCYRHPWAGHHIQEDDPGWVAQHTLQFFNQTPQL